MKNFKYIMKKRWFVLLGLISLLLIGLVFAFNFNSNIFNNPFNKYGELKVTSEHPFLVDGKWVEAKDLKVGDELFNINGKKVRITGIKDVNDEVEVYNLHVNGFENYFVNDVLVHNKAAKSVYVSDPLIDSSFLETPIKRFDIEKPKIAYGSPEINADNIDKIFSNEYALGQMGAKAVVYRDADGFYHTRFWSTGDGKIGNEVHHRDAIATLVSEEAFGASKRALKAAEENNEVLFDELSVLSDKRLKEATEFSTVRNQLVYPEEILFASQGFQLTLGKDGKIKYLDVDSSITATQISRKIKISGEDFAEMIMQIHDSISPELRGYWKVRIRGLSRLNIDGEIKLSDGLRVVELQE